MTTATLAKVPPMARDLARRYLLPCTGYVSSIANDMVSPGSITYDSRDMIASSQEGQLLRRRGFTIYQETDPTAPAGLLESVSKNMGADMRCRHMLDVQYPSAVPGQIAGPTALYTDASEQMQMGQMYVLTSTQGTRKVMGHEMGTLASPGTTHYPRSAASTEPRFKMVPLPYLGGGQAASQGLATQAVAYSRCTFPLQRAMVAGGARKMFQAGRYAFCPAFNGTPFKWDKHENPSATTGTEKVRIGPWGHCPPMFPPQLDTLPSTVAGAGTGNWWDGDLFYLAVIFQMEDGSFTIPNKVRGAGSGPSNGNLGLIQVGNAVSNPGVAYAYLQYKNIPIGPPGTVARILCRSYKTNVNQVAARTGAYQGMTPVGSLSDISVAKLYEIGVIHNNTQTTFQDYGANDVNSLKDDEQLIRYDHILPRPSRYVFEIERRAAIAYSRRQLPCAIWLAPTGLVAARDLNYADDAAAGYGATTQAFRLYKDTSGALTLKLRKVAIGAGTPSDQSISIAATDTLQSVVDTINTTLVGSAGGEWAAQVCGGAAPEIPATNLAPTVLDVANCTVTAGSKTISSSAGFADVAIGTRVKIIANAGTVTISSTAVVKGKTSDSALVLGDENGNDLNAGGTSNTTTATLRFWSDTGDDSWTSDTADWDVGNIRSYLATFPAVLGLKGSYLDSFPIDKQGIYHTISAPGTAAMAAQSFVDNQANINSVQTTAGVFMGGAPLTTSAVAVYSDAVYVLDNIKGGNTGEDFDYHTRVLNPRRGCIQYGTICHGDGWVGYLTREGYVVTDGVREVVISNPLLNPADGLGILVDQCMVQGAINGVADLPQFQVAHAVAIDGKLNLSFQMQTGLSGIDLANLFATAVASKYNNGQSYAFGGYGFDVKAGFNDKFYYVVSSVTYTVTLTAGSGYTGGTLATMLQTGMNAQTGSHGITFTVTYSGTTGLFTVTAGSGTFTINRLNDAAAAHATFGFKSGVAPAAASSFTSDWVRQQRRFWIQVSGLNCTFKWANAITTCAALMGYDAVDDGSENAQCSVADSDTLAPFYVNPLNNTFYLDESGTFDTVTITIPTPQQFVCVYDFSAGIEASGLAEVMGQGQGCPWSAPQTIRVGPMVKTWDGKLWGANDDNGGSTANGTIYQLDTGLYDQPTKATAVSTGATTITCGLNHGTGVLTAITSGDLRRVAVGAKAQGPGITGTATVIGKTVDATGAGLSVTISGTLTADFASASYTFWGAEIEAVAYFCADHCEQLVNQKAAQDITLVYACPSNEAVIVQHARDLLRTTARQILLADTGAANTVTHRAQTQRHIIQLPSAARTGADTSEFAVFVRNASLGLDPIARAEIRGGDARYKVLQSSK